MVEGPHQFDIESIKASLKRRQKIGRIAFGLWMGALFFIFILFAWASTRASRDVSAELAGAQAEMRELRQTADSEIQKLRDEFGDKVKKLEAALKIEQRRIPGVRNSITHLEGQARKELERMGKTVERALAEQTKTINRLRGQARAVAKDLDSIAPQLTALQGQAQETQEQVAGVQGEIASLRQIQKRISTMIVQFQHTLQEAERNSANLAREIDLTRREVDRKFVDLARGTVARTFWLRANDERKDEFLGWRFSVGKVGGGKVKQFGIVDDRGNPSKAIFTAEDLAPKQTYEFTHNNRTYLLVIDAIIDTRKGVGNFTMFSRNVPHVRVSIIPEYRVGK